MHIRRSKVENSSIDLIETPFLEGLANHPNKASNEGWRLSHSTEMTQQTYDFEPFYL